MPRSRSGFFVSGGMLSLGLMISAGCQPSGPEPVSFEPNLVFARRFELTEELPPMIGVLSDSQVLLSEWFGTPDQPKLPPLFAESAYRDLVRLERLQMAAGPAPPGTEPSDHGLYRQLCVSCHGETGQGRGPVAASQNPYPRDYRMGVFKYKSTPRNSKPTRKDLHRSLVQGLAGSQMPKFDKLSKEQLEALSDYVIYLSIRGELERQMIKYAVFELDLDPSVGKRPDRLYDPASPDAKDQLEAITEQLTAIADAWIEAEDAVVEFEPPAAVPVKGMSEDATPEALADSIAKGKEIFTSPNSGCAKCHGESGKGDGLQLPDYDDWTKDYTKLAGIEPTDHEALLPLLAIGALKPQPLLPRNLVEGKFRGGKAPIDLYRRIRYGIAGSTMPAASIVASRDEPGLMSEDLWHLVNYVLSLSEPIGGRGANPVFFNPVPQSTQASLSDTERR